MLIEVYKKDDGYYTKTKSGMETFLTSLELDDKSIDKAKLKAVLKLREQGFTADEIIEMKKEGVL